MTSTMRELHKTRAKRSVDNSFGYQRIKYMKWFSLQTVLQIKAEDKYGYPDPTPTEMNHVKLTFKQ